ncbi:MAG: LptE family protein [bacterium]
MGRLLVLAGALGAAGCGAYGFSSSLLPDHIRSVAVPLPENKTNRGDLGTALADSLTEAFLKDQSLKVVSEKDADSIVEAQVLEYRREPFTFDAQENVQTYRVEIVLEARYVDVRKNHVIWEEKHLAQWDTYNFAAVGGHAAETEEIGIGRVLAKLTDDIINRTLQAW